MMGRIAGMGFGWILGWGFRGMGRSGRRCFRGRDVRCRGRCKRVSFRRVRGGLCGWWGGHCGATPMMEICTACSWRKLKLRGLPVAQVFNPCFECTGKNRATTTRAKQATPSPLVRPRHRQLDGVIMGSMRSAFALGVLFISQDLLAAGRASSPTTAPARISSVTVYQGSALVTREVQVPAGAGQTELVVMSLPGQTMDNSLY